MGIAGAGRGLQLGQNQRGVVAGFVPFFHNGAQGGLNHFDPGFHFRATFFGIQQAFLHIRDLFHRDVEPFLCHAGFFDTVVAFQAKRVQPLTIDRLFAQRLFAGCAATQAIHQQNRGGKNRPAQNQRAAGQQADLGLGRESQEPSAFV